MMTCDTVRRDWKERRTLEEIEMGDFHVKIVQFQVQLQGEGEQSGIIPRLCKDLFVRIDKDSDSEFSVEVRHHPYIT